MKGLSGKFILTVLLVLCCVPVSFAHDTGCGKDRREKCPHSVPEGGSSATYLAGAGLICASALLVRSRQKRSEAK